MVSRDSTHDAGHFHGHVDGDGSVPIVGVVAGSRHGRQRTAGVGMSRRAPVSPLSASSALVAQRPGLACRAARLERARTAWARGVQSKGSWPRYGRRRSDRNPRPLRAGHARVGVAVLLTPAAVRSSKQQAAANGRSVASYTAWSIANTKLNALNS